MRYEDDPSQRMLPEEAAIEFAKSKKNLRRRFATYMSVMNPALKREHFSSTTLDFESKRLVGNGDFYLQWQLRPNPDQPISYSNQQVRSGCVHIKAKEQNDDG